jgi:hypothetical protein
MNKKLIYPILLLPALLTSGLTAAQAQDPARMKGAYWVVETNRYDPSYSIVRFYDHQDQLLYEEKIRGVSLDITRPRTQRLLNKALQQATGNTLVAGQLKRSKALLAAAPAHQ